MRILTVTHYYPEHLSGVEIVAGELAARFVRLGAEVAWVASTGPPGPGRLPVAAWNVTERRLGFPYPIWGPGAWARLWSEVGRADLVHLHDCLYMGNAMAYLFARLRRRPVVVTQHIGPVPYSNPILRGMLGLANRTLGRVALGGCDRAVFISRRVADYFGRLVRFRRRPEFIPNGVDVKVFSLPTPAQRASLRQELGWPQGRPVALFVGRFVEKKGMPLLQQLAPRFPGWLWVFVGWGPLDPAGWGLKGVVCPGPLPQAEVARYYRAADLLILPSVGEGFPMVVQEAMACGLPAAVTDETAQGLPEAEGLLLTAPPSVGAWEALLTRLGQDGESLEAMRPRVTEFARRWDWDACAAAYWRAFGSVARAKGRMR